MALKLGSLYVSLDANASGLFRTLSQAAASVERFSKEIKRAAKDVSEVSTTLMAVGGAALHLAAQVNGPAAAAMSRLETSAKQLAVPVAMMLLPAVMKLADGMQSLARWVDGLNPSIKAAVGTIATWVAGIGGAAFVVGKLSGLLGALAGVFSGVFSAIASVGLGPIIAIAVGIGALIAVVVYLHRAWRQNWGGIQEFTASVVESIAGFFKGGTSWIADAWVGLFKLIRKVMNQFVDGIAIVQKKLGVKWVDTEGLRSGFDGLLGDLQSGEFFGAALKFGKSTAQQFGDGFKDELAIIGKELGIDKFLKGISNGGHLAQVVKSPIVSGAFTSRAMAEQLRAANSTVNMRDNIEATMGKPLTERQQQTGMMQGFFQRKESFAGAQQLLDSKQLTRTAGEALKLAFSDSNFVRTSGGMANVELTLVKRFSLIGEGIQKAMEPALDALGQAGKAFGTRFLSKMGDMGQLIQDSISTAISAGPWAALGQAIAELLTRTQAFTQIMAAGDDIMKHLAEAAEPLMRAFVGPLTRLLTAASFISRTMLGTIKPLFELLGTALEGIAPILLTVADILTVLGPVFALVAAPLQLLFSILNGFLFWLQKLLSAVGLGLIGAVAGITKGWNMMVEWIAKSVDDLLKMITGKNLGVGDIIRAGKFDTSAMDTAWKALNNTIATNDDLFTANGVAVAGATAAVTKFSDSLTNVPTGFKTTLARFNAQDGQGGGVGAALATLGGGGGGSWVIQGDVHIEASDPEMLFDQLHRHVKKRAVRKGKSPLGF